MPPTVAQQSITASISTILTLIHLSTIILEQITFPFLSIGIKKKCAILECKWRHPSQNKSKKGMLRTKVKMRRILSRRKTKRRLSLPAVSSSPSSIPMKRE